MRLKICGLRRQEDLESAAQANAGYCGFIFHPKSPRYLAPEKAAQLNSYNMLRVGVFVTSDCEEIENIMKIARLDYAQLHGGQSVDCGRRIGPERVIRTLWPARFKTRDELENMARSWASFCSFYLLDAGKSGGGSGQTLDWHNLANLNLPGPWFLAGGLNAFNISAAVKACAPDGLDLNSGVEEKPGVKNRRKIMDAAKALRESIL